MTEPTDPTFYRTPRDAVAAAPEQLAYVAAFDPAGRQKDAIAVVDCDPRPRTTAKVVGWAELPTGRQRAAPFRLERVLERAVPDRGHGDHGGRSSVAT